MSLPPAPWLVDTSLRASVVILLVFGVRPALRRWIGSHAMAWLWLVIAARLLLPLPVFAPWFVPTLLPVPMSAAAAVPFAFRVSVSSANTPANPRATANLRRVPSPQIRAGLPTLTLVWLCGVLLAGARLAWGWRTTSQWANRTSAADTCPGLQAIYLTLPAALRRDVALRLSDSLDVPALAGLLRPQIWLPRTLPDTLAAAELRQVLLHELGHAHRGDLLAQWLCALVCCLHWFNPLVWLLARCARIDRELACDAWVLSHQATTAEPVASYGHTLLKVVEGMGRTTSRALPMVSMAAGRHHLGLRVREIRAFRPVAPWRGVCALALVTAFVAACTLRSAVAGADTSAAGSAAPVATTSPSPTAPVSSPPASPLPTPSALAPSAPLRQVEIESKFIEITKSNALTLEKSGSYSSPVASVFHQIFAQFAARGSSAIPAIFRSALLLPRDLQPLVRQLNETKGVDLLSAPRVTTRSGQMATIEIIRDIFYPTAFQHDKGLFDKPVTTPTNFDQKKIGLTLEVMPTLEAEGDVIDLSLTWTLTNLDGFVDANGKPVPSGKGGAVTQFPVLDTHSVSTVATLTSGATVVYGGDDEHHFARKSLQFATDETKRKLSPAKDDDRLVLVFVTATLVNPSGAEAPPAAAKTSGTTGAAPQSADAPSSLPYGAPAPGKPGFAISPYAPDAGIVDLRGFPRGQSVRDPYTGKQFRVP